jgi:uncharacterized membrane protein (UPF0127 family)
MKYVAMALCALLLVACGNAEEQYDLEIAGAEFSVEVVDTPETRARGLMFRTQMDEEAGMLFVFETEDAVAFYMRNTLIPLSIAYVDSRLVIQEIHDMQPLDETPIPSSVPVMYALEVNQGAFTRAGVSVGDRLILSAGLTRRIGR